MASDAASAPAGRPRMLLAATDETETSGVAEVGHVVDAELRWIFRAQPVRDYGIDAHAEVVRSDRTVSGRLIALQIKSGDSWFSEPIEGGWRFRESDQKHVPYWLEHCLPVVLVLVDGAGVAYWQVVDAKSMRMTPKGFVVDVPASHRFDKSALDELESIADRPALWDDLEQAALLLPSDAVGHLRRAHAGDRAGALLVASMLAEGRSAPGAAVESLIAAVPTWIETSPHAKDLWLAIAGYALQHNETLLAARTLQVAARAGGTFTARLLALAGVVFIEHDRVRAEQLLLEARTQGSVLVADVGLAALSIPEGEAHPARTPPSLDAASPEEIDAEHVVLNFLAENAIRDGDLDLAVDLRRRMSTSSEGGGPKQALSLAHTLLRRVVESGPAWRKDLREAVELAERALLDMRRWSGPSEDAAGLLAEIHLIAGDAREAFLCALPAELGGRAVAREAGSADLTVKGVVAAIATGDRSGAEALVALLAEGSEFRLYADAIIADTGKQTSEEIGALWEPVIAAATDDAMAARAAARFVHAGIWNSRIDDLHQRGIIPPDLMATYRAVFDASDGRYEVGIARLRQLAKDFSIAAIEVVQIVEAHNGVAAAIRDCEVLLRRWRIPLLVTKLLDLYRANGDEPRALATFESILQDEAFPGDTRLAICKRFVQEAATREQFGEAATLARRGLEFEADPSLAWGLVMCLTSLGNYPEARRELSRWALSPVSELEIRCWAQLRLGDPLSAADAETLLALIDGRPDDAIRAHLVRVLVLEVHLDPEASSRGFIAKVRERAEYWATTIGPDGDGLVATTREALSAAGAVLDTTIEPGRFRELCERVAAGHLRLEHLATEVGRPYGLALLQRPAGLLAAHDPSPGLRPAARAACEQLADEPACVIDLSSAHLLNGLEEADQDLIRDAIRRATIATEHKLDALRTRDHARTLGIATGTILRHEDGRTEINTLTPLERRTLVDQARDLETTAAFFDTQRSSSEPASIAADVVRLAKALNLPLLCDDVALTQEARRCGVPAFGLLDLATYLEGAGSAIDVRRVRLCLLDRYAMDLPLTAADIIDAAIERDWELGPVHLVLARRAIWTHPPDPDWWLTVATAAAAASSDALVRIARAASNGAVAATTSGRRTMRAQEIVIEALAGAWAASVALSSDFANRVFEGADQREVPQTRYVLQGLASRLGELGSASPDLDAMRTLQVTNLFGR